MAEGFPATALVGGSKSHLEYCDYGFRTTGDPRVDLTRLTALCGASNGLGRVWESDWAIYGRESGEEAEAGHQLRGSYASSGCGRFVIAFAGDGSGREVHVQVRAREQSPVECRLSQSGFCPSARLVCDPKLLLLSTSGPAYGDATGTSSATRSMSKVNVEWWALPIASPRPPSSFDTPTQVLPSVE